MTFRYLHDAGEGALVLLKRRLLQSKPKDVKKYISWCDSKKAIEIGGPSALFSRMGQIPIYPVLKSLDGVNYSTNTIWEGKLQDGKTYQFDDRIGYQYIAEATAIPSIPHEAYEILLTSHCLEHVANPLKALKEWSRILKKNGLIILVVPHKSYTFDHRRSVTSFRHLCTDESQSRGEDDLTHRLEILKLHNTFLDFSLANFDTLEKRTLANHKIRSIHHHVFDVDLLKKMLEHSGFAVLFDELIRPFHQVVVAQKNIT